MMPSYLVGAGVNARRVYGSVIVTVCVLLVLLPASLWAASALTDSRADSTAPDSVYNYDGLPRVAEATTAHPVDTVIWLVRSPAIDFGYIYDPSAYRDATNGETSLYRAVSSAERADIESFGGFRAGPNSYEGKLFATSAEDAARYGRINDALTPGGDPFHIVETRVPTSLANSFESLTADGMQAIHVVEEQLGALNSMGQWNIWDSVPWVGKSGGF